MNVGVFGGSFNPIHNGHIKMAKEFIKRAQIDELIIVPTGEPFYKFNVEMANAEDRLEMCVSAFGSFAKISDIEIKKQGMSYTCDTLRQIKEMFPEGDLFMLCGSDVLNSINYWKNAEEIFSLAKLVSFIRPGADLNEPLKEKIKSGMLNVDIYEAEMPDISSTQIRKMIKDGKDISSLVPDEINRYIKENNLYR